MQSRHRYSALQAVEPKCEISVVLVEPHWGQGTTAGACGARARTDDAGGIAAARG